MCLFGQVQRQEEPEKHTQKKNWLPLLRITSKYELMVNPSFFHVGLFSCHLGLFFFLVIFVFQLQLNFAVAPWWYENNLPSLQKPQHKLKKCVVIKSDLFANLLFLLPKKATHYWLFPSSLSQYGKATQRKMRWFQFCGVKHFISASRDTEHKVHAVVECFRPLLLIIAALKDSRHILPISVFTLSLTAQEEPRRSPIFYGGSRLLSFWSCSRSRARLGQASRMCTGIRFN